MSDAVINNLRTLVVVTRATKRLDICDVIRAASAKRAYMVSGQLYSWFASMAAQAGEVMVRLKSLPFLSSKVCRASQLARPSRVIVLCHSFRILVSQPLRLSPYLFGVTRCIEAVMEATFFRVSTSPKARSLNCLLRIALVPFAHLSAPLFSMRYVSKTVAFLHTQLALRVQILARSIVIRKGLINATFCATFDNVWQGKLNRGYTGHGTDLLGLVPVPRVLVAPLGFAMSIIPQMQQPECYVMLQQFIRGD